MNSIFPLLLGVLVLTLPGLIGTGSSALAADATNKLELIELPDCQPDERLRRFDSAVSKVLAEHGFTPPLFFEKQGSLRVAISARPRLKPLGEASATSACEILQARIETTPDNQVTLELVPYAWVGSGYAILGKLFEDGLPQERAQIASRLQMELRSK
jgi:hypothetical protein